MLLKQKLVLLCLFGLNQNKLNQQKPKGVEMSSWVDLRISCLIHFLQEISPGVHTFWFCKLGPGHKDQGKSEEKMGGWRD